MGCRGARIAWFPFSWRLSEHSKPATREHLKTATSRPHPDLDSDTRAVIAPQRSKTQSEEAAESRERERTLLSRDKQVAAQTECSYCSNLTRRFLKSKVTTKRLSTRYPILPTICPGIGFT